jgi:hypothetical protein
VQEVFPRGFVLGQRVTVDIPLKGDMLGPVTLELRLPRIPQAADDDLWAPSIGYALLRHVRVWLNDTMLMDHERLWFDIRDQLFESPSRRAALQDLLGGRRSLTQDHLLLVPVHLPWSSFDTYFPLVALPGVRITMDIDTESYEKCLVLSTEARADATSGRIKNATYTAPSTVVVTLFAAASQSTLDILLADDLDATPVATGTVLAGVTTVALTVPVPLPAGGLVARCDGEVRRIVAPIPAFPGPTPELRGYALFDTVYLDRDEAYALIRSRHVYIYDTVLDMEAKTYRDVYAMNGPNTTTFLPTVKVDLSEINYPTRALVWVAYTEADAADPASYFRYVTDGLKTCRLSTNAQDIAFERPAAKYELVSTLKAGRRVASRPSGIYIHSWALDLGDIQPSGALTFAPARNPMLIATLNDSFIGTPAVVKVFAIVRRVLALYKGRAQFVFT